MLIQAAESAIKVLIQAAESAIKVLYLLEAAGKEVPELCPTELYPWGSLFTVILVINEFIFEQWHNLIGGNFSDRNLSSKHLFSRIQLI